MLYLECELKTPSAPREVDVIAVVKDSVGRIEQLVLEKAFLVKRGDRAFLPVWGISQNPDRTKVQVELPFESTGGTYRIWVYANQIFTNQDQPEVAT